MSGVPPVAEFDLPFAPDRLFWTDGDHLLAARTGTADPPLKLSVPGGQAQPAWGEDPSGLPRGTLTAITVQAAYGVCAYAERMQVPHDTEPFQRLVGLDVHTGERFWQRQYQGARDLAFGDVGDPFLLAWTDDGFLAYAMEQGDPAGWSRSVSPLLSQPWCLGPDGSPSLLAYGSPPSIVDCATGEPRPSKQTRLLRGECQQLKWAAGAILLAVGEYFWLDGAAGEPGTSGWIMEFEGDGYVEFRLPAGDSVGYHGIATSPSGKSVAYASGSELTVRTLPGLAPSEDFRTLRLAPATGRPRCVRYSPDGGLLAVNATPSGPGVTLLEAGTGACLWRHDGEDCRIEFSPSGARIALYGGNRVTCYDIDSVAAAAWTLRQQWERRGTPNRMVLAAIPDSQAPERERTWIGVVGANEGAGGFEYFRRLGDAAPLYKSEPDARVLGLAVSPGGDHCAVWLADTRLVARTLLGTPLQSWPRQPSAATRVPRDAAFVDARRLVDVRGDTWLRFYDVNEEDPTSVQFDEPLERVAVLPAEPPDDAVIAVASRSRCRLLRHDGGQITGKPIDVDGKITSLAFAVPGGGSAKLVITSSNADAALVLVDTRTGLTETVPHPTGIDQVVVSPDGRLLATAAGNDVRVASVSSPGDGRTTWRLPYPVTRAAFYPKGRALLVATEQPYLYMFDLDGEAAGRGDRDDADAFWWGPAVGVPHDLGFTADGKVLAVACEDGVHFYRGRGDE
ncbi:hypothetical protein ACQPZ8_32900 [Actinomadura nitritigenes]|uniref:WD40 repeat domain-containing protein n=1 Tax=Actinomadura nitritigenes TaxID=134602 RepID=UPI003D8EFA60